MMSNIWLVTERLPSRTALTSVDLGAHSVPVERSRGLTYTTRPLLRGRRAANDRQSDTIRCVAPSGGCWAKAAGTQSLTPPSVKSIVVRSIRDSTQIGGSRNGMDALARTTSLSRTPRSAPVAK